MNRPTLSAIVVTSLAASLLHAQSLLPSEPAKEFIYFGNRLLAVDTGASALTPGMVGVYKSVSSEWFLDVDGGFQWSVPPPDRYAAWGSAQDIPLVGDWNGDGIHDYGVYNPPSGIFFLDLNGDGAYTSNESKGWGNPYWIPVVGDWDDDGVDEIGAIAPGVPGGGMTWFRDMNGDFVYNPATDMAGWGSYGDQPLVGDWDGDGADDLGVYNPGSSIFFIDLNGDAIYTSNESKGWGVANWKPVVGDWDGDGDTDIGIINPGTPGGALTWFRDMNGDFLYDPVPETLGWGLYGETPVVGDWDMDGDMDVGVYSGNTFVLDVNGNKQYDGCPGECFVYGAVGDRPLVGNW